VICLLTLQTDTKPAASGPGGNTFLVAGLGALYQSKTLDSDVHDYVEKYLGVQVSYAPF
jgi:hypothetical protein